MHTWMRLVAVGLALVWASVGSGMAQTITLTAPVANVAVADGDDFATDALGHGWTMDRLRDFGTDYGFKDITVSGGIWQALVTDPTVEFYEPLFAGYSDPTYTMYFSRYDEGTPYGPLNPIDAAKYTHVSMRTSLPANLRTFNYGFWSTDYAVSPADGYAVQDNFPAVQGFRMFDIDLTGASWLTEKVASHTPSFSVVGKAWQGTVYGFMLRPTLSMPVGTTHQVDWVRLYDPTTSPTLTLRWTTSSIPNDGTYSVQLFADSDAAGFDGDLFVSGIANDGTYTLHTAALPPGSYYFYLRVVRLVSGAFQTVSTSAYSARLDIRAPPSMTIEAPSFTSGEDYATAQMGNAWDMSSAGDVASFHDIAFPSFANGVLSAFANSPDPQVVLSTRVGGVLKPIDPKRYRYLSFRMRVDPPSSVNVPDPVQRTYWGWVARLIWWNAKQETDGCVTKDIPVLEGWHRYTVDLWDRNLIETRPTAMPQLGWKVLPQVSALRLDPLEPYNTSAFFLDDVTLCAENRPTDGLYTVRWNLSDADTTACDLTIYYGYTSAAGYVEVPTPLVALTQVARGPGSYVWNMRNLGSGSYSLRFEVKDGVNTRSFLSEVPILIENGIPHMNISGMDPAIYYRSKGAWGLLHADGSGYTRVDWGHTTADAVAADYDGDGLMDCAVYQPSSGRWAIRSSITSNLWTGAYISYGWVGVTPVPADYSGDGKADLAVYEPSTGNWFIRDSATGQPQAGGAIAWGWNGVVPVPADYDGDKKADIAIFDANTGDWFVRQSSNGQTLGGNGLRYGWGGLIPVPADYDGDKKTDIAVYDAYRGDWYVRLSSTGDTLGGSAGIRQGVGSAIPVPGDFNHDGRADLVVYTPADGMWHFRFTSGGDELGGPWGWNGSNSKPVAGNFIAP